MLRCRQWQIK